MKENSCQWCLSHPLYIDYHDKEWGVPIVDDRMLFEFLILEGMQAGLNWLTILKKRDNYRLAFDNFDANKIIDYNQEKFNSLMQNPGIIRNKLKINAVTNNAKAYLEIQQKWHSFSHYIWHFVDNTPIQNHYQSMAQIPAKTVLSIAMSKDLKKNGFKFAGETICYAFMQAAGLVNDHLTSCHRYEVVKTMQNINL